MYYNNLNCWTVRDIPDGAAEAIEKISSELSLTPTTARLLLNRGCTTPEAAKRFIGKEEEELYDPFLMKDMDIAASRVADAVASDEHIVIYGDYDVDGVTSVSSLCLYLTSLGADVTYHIPCRMTEGYGMSSDVIDKLCDDGCSLIITVDTGITAISEIAHAKKLGIDVVVTDHHECHAELPAADAVVNPRRPDCEYPFNELAGVGVVFKLMCAVESLMNPHDSLSVCVRRIAHDYCDLVALGTIADVMPVIDENRLIVSYGLSLIERSPRPAITALINASESDSKRHVKRKITAGYIGFTLAPRINAAGRLRSASIAADLFLSKTSDEAKKIAEELCRINKLRQTEENRIVEEAYAKIAAEHDFEHDPVIVIADEKWNHGIIGIVSSRITERYGLPSILVSFDGATDGEISPADIGKGSGRSVRGLNLVEALSDSSELLEKYGGHELAAGLSLRRENLDAFRKRINEYARSHMTDGGSGKLIEAECVLDERDITIALAEEIYLLEPYGTSNPVPLFRADSFSIAEEVPLSGGKHVKLILRRGNMIITAMCFRRSVSDLDLYPGDVVDVMFTLDINEFQGTRTLQMIVRDIRLTSGRLEAEQHELETCAALTGESEPEVIPPHDMCAAAVPERNDFAAVYSTLRRELRVEHEVYSLRALSHLMLTCGYIIPLSRLRSVIMIFGELHLLGVEMLDREREIYSFTYIPQSAKRDLDTSVIYSRMKARAARSGKNLQSE